MGKVVKSILGGGGGEAQKSAQGAALAGMLAREGEANRELSSGGGSRRRRGRNLLTYLDDGGQSSLN